MKMTKSNTVTAGIDTAKTKLDIALHQKTGRWQVDNDPAGWHILVDNLTNVGVTRVGIEATGGYERGVVAELRQAGFTVLVLQPAQVRAFARFKLRHAKNDAIDAALIANCAANLEAPALEPDLRLRQLADLLTFIEQAQEDATRAKIRLEHITDERLRRIVKDDIDRLKIRRACELANIVKTLRQHNDLRRRLELLLSVPTIGLPTAVTLVVRMPELGHVTREEIAALAGLAPFDDESGKHKGQRHIAGGRDRVRRALYAAALPGAFRWNPALIALYQRLTKRGKPHRVALVACARKLLIFANAVLQRGTTWTTQDPTI